MNGTVRSNAVLYGNAGSVAPACRWSTTSAAGRDLHVTGRGMAVKPAFIAAQRPLGLAGGSIG
jgi:hypothetical protein